MHIHETISKGEWRNQEQTYKELNYENIYKSFIEKETLKDGEKSCIYRVHLCILSIRVMTGSKVHELLDCSWAFVINSLTIAGDVKESWVSPNREITTHLFFFITTFTSYYTN